MRNVHSLFLAVVLRETGETGKEFLARVHRVAEHHQETTNDTQVAEEEVEVEDEAITERLDDDDSEEATNSVFRVFLRDDRSRTDEHSLQHIRAGSRAAAIASKAEDAQSR